MTLALLFTLAQAAAPAPDFSITGRVVDAVTGRPVGAALVAIESLTRIDGSPILTGADGRFAFRLSQDGAYSIKSRKGGYAEGAPGRRRPGGTPQPVQLSAVTPSVDVIVRMWKLGAITGTVTDEAGEPVVGLGVRLLMRTVAGGRRQLTAVPASAMTDDRGIYRFSNLQAGEYLVLASPPAVSVKAGLDLGRMMRPGPVLAAMFTSGILASLQVGDASLAIGGGSAIPPPPIAGRLRVYTPTFYPSAASAAQASVVTLDAGEEGASIDVQLSPVPTARVSGTLMGRDGPAGNAVIRMVPSGADDLPADMLAAMSVCDATGAFTFAAVPAGQYVMRARGTSAGGVPDDTWLEMPLAVAGDDIDGLVAAVRPAIRIRARMQFDGNTPPPLPPADGRFTSLPYSLEREGNAPATMSVGAASIEQGAVVFGYPPGRYRVRVANSPRGWMFKSAMLNGVDVSETPFDLARDVDDLVLTFTDRWSGMSGAVQGAGGDAATVLVFPADAQAWTAAGPASRFFKNVRATASRQFGIGSLPPGDYFAIAVRDEDSADWRDPAALEAFARNAVRVTILEGEHKTIDLQVREVRR